jgi:phosphatidylglycerol:prolipoprotein diacylglycerol transferase
VVATVIGARLNYVAVNYQEFAHDYWKIFNPYQGGVLRLSGLVMNGGLFLSLAACTAYMRWNRMPILTTLDVMMPSVALVECLLRMGCFLNGCCYGTATAMPWGVTFPPGSPAGDYQRLQLHPPSPIHPTQLYSSFYGLAILIALLVIERQGKRFPGSTFFSFLMLYGAARFVVEFFRHYHDQTGVWFGLTHNQHLSIVLLVGSAAAAMYLNTNATRQRGRTGPT